MVFDKQVCRVGTQAVYKFMPFILHTVPVALSADPKLALRPFVRDSLVLLLEQLDIQVVTGGSKSVERVREMIRDNLLEVRWMGWPGCAILIIPPPALTPDGHSKMYVVCPHDNAGELRITWMFLVNIPISV